MGPGPAPDGVRLRARRRGLEDREDPLDRVGDLLVGGDGEQRFFVVGNGKGLAGARFLLIRQILEMGLAPLKTGGINVGQIVGNVRALWIQLEFRKFGDKSRPSDQAHRVIDQIGA